MESLLHKLSKMRKNCWKVAKLHALGRYFRHRVAKLDAVGFVFILEVYRSNLLHWYRFTLSF